jgi:hypothetical protein
MVIAGTIFNLLICKIKILVHYQVLKTRIMKSHLALNPAIIKKER